MVTLDPCWRCWIGISVDERQSAVKTSGEYPPELTFIQKPRKQNTPCKTQRTS